MCVSFFHVFAPGADTVLGTFSITGPTPSEASKYNIHVMPRQSICMSFAIAEKKIENTKEMGWVLLVTFNPR